MQDKKSRSIIVSLKSLSQSFFFHINNWTYLNIASSQPLAQIPYVNNNRFDDPVAPMYFSVKASVVMTLLLQ